ncbi:DUF5691 domain-containing protein [Chitinophaga sancti]|uniref:DUF5691 domain-containing protein n=1 Tax=Chitinophaga sancti TaxID=1004 RepID=A0A1K1P6W2_9BACT|nr:DUF5691 domain-containing protein [Chitinophaga sancti]WQD60466.1 DUF5691 domain-containing protein [Chitinophaga sancti]WQG87406.1 DUF5691 domain-containing protein [Chitinophaga sancti]SFW42422.1 hypothetical protein SAMN05661012_01770 [Chitinophaga sancti]
MWNNIVNTVLLGTGKKQLRKDDLPPALSAVADTVLGDKSLDVETQFLHLAAIALNYRQSGVTALQDSSVTLEAAPDEVLPYCSPAAWQALHTAIDMDLHALILYWMEACAAAQQIAPPEFIPTLMDMSIREKQWRELAVAVCGKRGEWLGQLNPAWAFKKSDSTEERWQTGSLDERKQVLTALRQENPSQAREWLQKTWSQENAATRAELLKVLQINAGEEDIPWLETLLTDKSSKVKDETWSLLKQLSTSSIVQVYWQLLQQSIKPAKKGLLNKKSLEISLQLPSDKRIADSGIQLLSSSKSANDDIFILYQLTTYVPPAWWEEYLQTDKKGVLSYFNNTELTEKFIQALGLAASRFKDLDWFRLIIKEGEDFFMDAFNILPAHEQETYALRFFEKEVQFIIRCFSEKDYEWGLPITRELFKWIAKNPYQYNRNFFDKQVQNIPLLIAGELESFTPELPAYQATWKNTTEHIKRLLTCKAAINKAFSNTK